MGEEDHNPPLSKTTKHIRKSKNKNNEPGKLLNLKICTYNARSLSSRVRMLELDIAIEKINWDIIGLAEIKRKGCNIEEHKEYIFCYIGETEGMHGVGFLIRKTFKTNIVSFVGISERVGLLKMSFKNVPLSIIQVYAPTESSSEEEIEKFYMDIQKAQEQADKTLLVIGDFNAKIGYPKHEEHMIMGRHGYGQRNSRGERLIQYAYENKLSVMNTYFKKRNSRKWTWISPDQNTKNEIDFILSYNPKVITNLEVLNRINFPSDHRMVRCSLNLQTPKTNRKSFKGLKNMLKSTKEKETYLKKLKGNVTTLNETTRNTEDVQALSAALEKTILNSLEQDEEIKTNHKKSKIISEQTLKMISRRTELLTKKNKSKEMRQELKELYKKTNKAIRQDYENHRRVIIERNMATFRSSKRAFKELSSHKKWIQGLSNGKDETRNREDIIKRATAFYSALYRRPSQEGAQKDEQTKTNTIRESQLKENAIDPINEHEIARHIKRLKSEKSPGPDKITNEALKLGASILVPYLTKLFNLIVEQEQIPKQWCSSYIILLYKKGNPLDINNYRPISLLSTIYKLFSSIILSRISPDIDKNQPIEQAGFRPHYSTMNHIHVAEQIIEKYKEFNMPLYIAFVDYYKAFDSISHISIWKALRKNNINEKYINIIKNIYTKSVSKIKLERQGEEFEIGKGVRQGDPLSPKLFIAVLENIFQSLEWKNNGIWILNKRLTHLRFADDIALFSESATELEYMLQSLNTQSQKIGLKMNASKTKIITNSSRKPIKIEGKPIEYVNDYVYLGKQVSFEANSNEKEIDRRINIAWKKFWAQKEILKENYSPKMKKVIMDSCILPSLTYASQTWVYTERVKNKIMSCQHAMERSILKLRRIQKTRNADIRKKTNVTDALHHSLRQKWKWAGHIARYQDRRWTHQTTKWKGPIGKRNVGRQRRRWQDDIQNIAGYEWMKIAKNREEWCKLEEAFTQEGLHTRNK